MAADRDELTLIRLPVEPGIVVTRIDSDALGVHLELADGRIIDVRDDTDLTASGLPLVRAHDDLKRPNFAVALPDGPALDAGGSAGAGVKIAFLITTIYEMGGTESAVTTQANALAAAGHDVEIISVYRPRDEPPFPLAAGVVVRDLVDTRDADACRPGARGPAAGPARVGPDPRCPRRRRRPGGPADRDRRRAGHRDPCAARAGRAAAPGVRRAGAPGAPVVVPAHRRPRAAPHLRAPSRRGRAARRGGGGAGCGSSSATPPRTSWSCPTRSRPASGPRSLLDEPLIVAAGRLGGEKQYPQLVSAFALDRRPAARLAAADLRRRPRPHRDHAHRPPPRPLGPRRAARPDQRPGQRVGARQHLGDDLALGGLPAGDAGGDGRRRAGRLLRLPHRTARDHRPRGRRPAGDRWAPSRSWRTRCSGSPPTTSSGAASAPERCARPRRTTSRRSAPGGSRSTRKRCAASPRSGCRRRPSATRPSCSAARGAARRASSGSRAGS